MRASLRRLSEIGGDGRGVVLQVLDSEEFKRRTKEYDRLKYHHYYFMALKADAIIDATEKGNASRFINHSCDPNSETQKASPDVPKPLRAETR